MTDEQIIDDERIDQILEARDLSDHETYAELAARTAVDLDGWGVDTWRIRLAQSALGLAGERLEFEAAYQRWKETVDQRAAAIDELSDLEWYLAIGCRAVGSWPGALPTVDLCPERMRKGISGICETAKKALWHGKSRDDSIQALRGHLWEVDRTLAEYADALDIARSRVRAHNVAKLADRYPNGFEERFK